MRIFSTSLRAIQRRSAFLNDFEFQPFAQYSKTARRGKPQFLPRIRRNKMARGLTRTLQRAAARNTGIAGSKAGLSVVVDGDKIVFTFNAMQIAVTDALAYASQKLFDFLPGKIRIKGGTASLAFAVLTARAGTINDSAAMDWSVGSVAASSITLASTMVDIIAKQDKTLDGAVAAYTSAQAADVAAAATLDGTTTAVDVFLNIGFPTNTEIDADGTLAVTGTFTLRFENWGDV